MENQRDEVLYDGERIESGDGGGGGERERGRERERERERERDAIKKTQTGTNSISTIQHTYSSIKYI